MFGVRDGGLGGVNYVCVEDGFHGRARWETGVVDVGGGDGDIFGTECLLL